MPEGPRQEFGKRRPVEIETAAPAKRSHHVALLLMGTLAVGGSAYALMPRENCHPNQPGMAADLPGNADCARGWSSRGGGGGSHGWSGTSSLFRGDASTNVATSTASPDGSAEGVTRGGFGAFGRALAAHFSGGE
jgi:hypothetical protein